MAELRRATGATRAPSRLETLHLLADALHAIAHADEDMLSTVLSMADQRTLALIDHQALEIRDLVDDVRTDRRLERRRRRHSAERTA